MVSKINGLGKLVSSQFNFGILVYFKIPQLSRGNTLQLGHCSQITLGLIPLVAFHRLLLLGRISVAPPPKLPQTGLLTSALQAAAPPDYKTQFTCLSQSGIRGVNHYHIW